MYFEYAGGIKIMWENMEIFKWANIIPTIDIVITYEMIGAGASQPSVTWNNMSTWFRMNLSTCDVYVIRIPELFINKIILLKTMVDLVILV